MATPRLGLVVEDKPTELSCMHAHAYTYYNSWLHRVSGLTMVYSLSFSVLALYTQLIEVNLKQL